MFIHKSQEKIDLCSKLNKSNNMHMLINVNLCRIYVYHGKDFHDALEI